MILKQRSLSFVATLVLSVPTVSTVSTVTAQNGDRAGEIQRELPEEWRLPASPPLTPAASKEAFVLQPGYRIDLVASEPLIGDPVQIAFDGRGDLWVVEMRGYMPDANGTGEMKPVGRVVKLHDQDGDGIMDEADVFLDHLVLPRGIAPAFDGLLLIEPPNLLYCRDTDGDGRADDTQVLVSGFDGLENPEHAGNGLRYGIDNFYETSQHHQSFRFRQRADGDLDVETRKVPKHGQWGVARDDLGRLYYSPNSDPLIGDAFPKHYSARNTEAGGLPGVPRHVATDRSTWPIRINPGVNRGYQKATLREDGTLRTFTAACGPEVFRGTLVKGAEGDAFVCETAGNLVKRYDLQDQNGVPTATPVHEKSEFLASTDERFRPVNLLTGPDGGLYIVDFARGIVQHRIYMTSWLRKQVEERELAAPIGMGRIWRVVDEDSATDIVRPDLTRMENFELAELMTSNPNGALRDTAQRLLVERTALDVSDQLRRFASDQKMASRYRLHAIWTLQGIDSIDSSIIEMLATDPDPLIREHAARVSESLPPRLRSGPLSRLAFDKVDRVRLQAVLSIGELPSSEAMPLFDAVLAEQVEDPAIRSAIQSGLAGREVAMLRSQGDPRNGGWLGGTGPAQRQVIRELVEPVLKRRRPDEVTALLAVAVDQYAEAPATSLLILDQVSTKTRPGAKNAKSMMLLGSPAGWDAVLTADPADCDPRIIETARAVDTTLRWVGRPGTTTVTTIDTSPDGLVARGRRLYGHCMTCHQATGRGLPPVYPPLDDSPFVTGSPERLTRILLHGLQGRIKVDGRVYNQSMPAAPYTSDVDLAAVMSYIRQAWDNIADPIEPEFVAKVREDTKGRVQPWSPEELTKFED
jgi:putative membrane-bound dehydrogenase-like protein